MNAAASPKIEMLNSSMRCFMFGLLGLIPLIGLPFALVALWISGQIRAKEKEMWNAARSYRIWGVVCAAVGTVLWTVILAIVVARALMIAQGLG
jgi:TRAP-type mannitol/chloroaromatic compound transport system permease small subunit